MWTCDPTRDFRPLPAGAQVGDFVHEADVRSFLNLISSDNPESNYPYSTPEYREMFRHTLWMVPGVKEASALSKLLKEHPVFGAYKIANVAGEGDAEMPYDNALTLVKQVIKENRYTITISCGKLTTGVTVPEWTAVMMLTGSASTAASGYMQTIFRVQSAGVLDGKQKERCYVFDFAPDRALNVISEVNRITKRGRTNEEQNRIALGEFLNFCPMIAVDGTQMAEYDVPKMMRQIKRLTVDKAIKSGFDDESVYKQDTGFVMDEDDVQLFHTLSDKLSEQKAAKKETKVRINNQGLTNEEYDKAGKISNKPKRERTKEDDALLKKLQEQKKEREKVIRLLRNVSIRLPLLIYGAKVDLTESIKMADFITLVDDESWQEFMPKTVDKPLFRKLLKYYDEDVVIGAGLRIRRMAKAADELPPTKRVQRIAEIFSHFRNPDKETVLTPWRVVNLHLSNISSDLRGQDNKDESHQLALFSSQKSNSMAMSYISGDEVQKQYELIGKYKVIMGKVVPRGGEVGVDPSVGYRVTSTLQVLSPGSVFTDSYLLLAAFDHREEAIHFAEYMCLKFPRFLLHETYSSMNISKQNFRFVPFLDYSREWTDKELFKRYGCSEEEVSMIESIIRPMEYVFHE